MGPAPIYIGDLTPNFTKNQFAGYDVANPTIIPSCIKNQ